MVLVTGLLAEALVGHPQFLVYVWIFILLILAGFMVGRMGSRQDRGRVVTAMAIGGVLSVPVYVPVLGLLRTSARSEAMALGEFMSRGVAPETWIGLLSPLFRCYNGFLPTRSSLMTHLGPWVFPALILLVWHRWITKSRCPESATDPDDR